MSIASKVKAIIETKCPGTFSLYAGYGVESSKPVNFPCGVQILEKRNEQGRVTRARYQYADDSQLEYTYRNEQYTLKVS